MNVLRVLCGFCFIPHAIGKFTARDASFAFFSAAGFRPPALFAYLSMTLEVSVGILLVLGVAVKPAALVACVYLLVAAGAVIKVEKKWLWHIGGCEYPVFWAVCCGLVLLSS
jgi:putative oxidoreductase